MKITDLAYWLDDPETGSDPREYNIGGGWGNCINWTHPEQFNGEFTNETEFDVYGFKQRRPKVGDTLKAEFERSYKWFRFVSVDLKRDPDDMFFAKVRCFKQEMK